MGRYPLLAIVASVTSSPKKSQLLSNTRPAAIPFFYNAARAHSHNTLAAFFDSLFAKYGTEASPHCVEVGLHGSPRFIITTEPEHIKAVLTTKFGHFGKGPKFHEVWHPFLGDSIFTTDGGLWQESRALIRPMFVRERVSDLAIFEQWTDVMIKQIRPGMDVDMMDLFYRMTLDVTTHFLLGTSVNSLEKSGILPSYVTYRGHAWRVTIG